MIIKKQFKINRFYCLQRIGVQIVCLLNHLLAEIVEQYQDYIFYSVNRDEMLELCQELDILGIPSFVAFDQGKEIGRFVSKLRKTKEEIIDFIDSLS